MANEISVSVDVSLTKGNLSRRVTTRKSIDQTGNGVYHNTVSVGTTEESIATFGDITTEGLMYLRNLDTTNYVQWGFSTTVYGGRMAPGMVAGPFQAEPGLTLFLKANTAACLVEVFVAEA